MSSWELLGRVKGENGTNGEPGTPGVGVPAGGSTGQVLTKIDESDYNTTWSTPTSVGSDVSFVSAGGMLCGTSETDFYPFVNAIFSVYNNFLNFMPYAIEVYEQYTVTGVKSENLSTQPDDRGRAFNLNTYVLLEHFSPYLPMTNMIGYKNLNNIPIKVGCSMQIYNEGSSVIEVEPGYYPFYLTYVSIAYGEAGETAIVPVICIDGNEIDGATDGQTWDTVEFTVYKQTILL